MGYVCKCPKNLSKAGYLHKILEEYQCNVQYSFSRNEMERFLSFILHRITFIIEDSRNNLCEALNYLLKIEKLSRMEYELIPKGKVNPETAFDLLFGVMETPLVLVELISNNMQFELEQKKENYVKFLQEITIKCIKDLVEANTPKPKIKKNVTFVDSGHKTDKTVSKSKRQPSFQDLDEDKENKGMRKKRRVEVRF